MRLAISWLHWKRLIAKRTDALKLAPGLGKIVWGFRVFPSGFCQVSRVGRSAVRGSLRVTRHVAIHLARGHGQADRSVA
jgi:hypothetical protein